MDCILFRYKTETPLYWVSLKTKNKYPYEKYTNHGHGGEYKGYLDLPKSEYPYTVEYKIKQRFRCCEICNCKKKNEE